MNGFVRCISVVGLAALGTFGCAESSLSPPAAPTPLPPGKIGELTIACPPDIGVRALGGVSAPVVYQPPRVSGGQQPVTSGCTPPSGSAQPIGASTLECAASDAIGQTARCSASITVLPPPRLGATKLLAFGDSLTAGVVSEPAAGSARFRLRHDLSSYPRILQRRLQQAYPVQTITVVNSGLPGESAANAVSRFVSDLGRMAPDVVLIMEGSNDVLGPAEATARERADPAGAALEAMVQEALKRGVGPILATIPPLRASVRGGSAAEAVTELNRQIRSIAAARRVPLVDAFAVISGGNCPAGASVRLPCLGADGLHLTRRGYELLAGAFFDAVVEHHDDSPGMLPASGPGGAQAAASAPAAAAGGLR